MPAKDSGERLQADVAIVGGGLSGLMAARVLAQAGVEPLVLEARSRVGGRLLSESLGEGGYLEFGGQYIGYRDRRLMTLAADLGIETFPTYDRGRHLLELSGSARRYRGNVPRVAPRTLLALLRARRWLDRRARRVEPSSPWTAPDAAEWDAQGLDDWLDRSVRRKDARSILDAAVATIWGEDQHGVNLLSALAFVSAGGGFEALGATRGGLLERRVNGGAMLLAETIAAELGERVVLDCPVEEVVDRGEAVEVAGRRARVTARHAIVALPPVLCAELQLEPTLPESRRRAFRALPLGSMIRAFAVYQTPFWRERGLSGRALCADGPITATLDGSPPGGLPCALTAYAPGSRARKLRALPARERRQAVLAALTRLFGPDAAHPEHYVEKDWDADPWSRGCYFGLAARGAWCDGLRALASPIGSVHWAGSETAFESYGGMNGALLSGERAAEEVLHALAGESRPAVKSVS